MDLSSYLRDHHIDRPCSADVVLALLRINTPESLAEAQRIMGRPIIACPPAIPPWPPKPARQAKREARIARIKVGTQCKKLDQIRIGWTIDQVITRLGVTRRDVKHWISRRYLELTP